MYKVKRITPLRYPGGKAKFAPFMKRIYDQFSLHNNYYAEGYTGGAGVALDLLLSGFCKEIHINDVDPAIYAFWKSVKTKPKELIQLIENCDVNMDEWYKQQQVLANISSSSILEVGFATFFLNRTNRSGILKAGVIGGKKQNGNYKIDARFNKKNLIQRIKTISKKKNSLFIYNLDAIEFIHVINTRFTKRDLIYLDPPYYVKGQGLYRNFYEHGDHQNVRDTLHALSANWLVSYDNCIPIKTIYQNLPCKEYSLDYSAHRIKQGKEIVFFSERLKNAATLPIK